MLERPHPQLRAGPLRNSTGLVSAANKVLCLESGFIFAASQFPCPPVELLQLAEVATFRSQLASQGLTVS
jgi:hypothetical protein